MSGEDGPTKFHMEEAMNPEDKTRLIQPKPKNSGPVVMKVTLYTILIVALLWVGIRVYLATMGDG